MVNELEFRVLLLRWTGTSRLPSVTVTTSPSTLLTVPCCTNTRTPSRLPSGDETSYVYMESRGAVWIVPVADDGTIALNRQYRYAVDNCQVPVGGKHDHDGSDEELACREPGEIIEVQPAPSGGHSRWRAKVR